MSGVELGLGLVGLVGVVDTCIKRGSDLREKVEAFRDVDGRLGSLVERAEMTWSAIEVLIKVLKGSANCLDEKHFKLQASALHRLQNKLRDVNSELESLKPPCAPLPKATKVSMKIRLKYTVKENGLENDIEKIESWLQTYYLIWFNIMTSPSKQVDQQLEATAKDQGNTVQNDSASVIQAAKHFRKALKSDGSDPNRPVFLDPSGLKLHGVRSVPFSPVTLAQRKGKDATVLLDPVTCKSLLFMEDVKEDIRNFANKLRHADPFKFGLLQCKSVLKGEVSVDNPDPSVDKSSLSFVFHIPETHPQIESVRAHLLRGPRDKHHSFPQRLSLARHLVRAVHYVHMYKFVHKNIRPETILILTGVDQRPRTPPPTIGEKTLEDTAVLVGFDVLRNASGETRRVVDDDWEKDLYRHPSRRGSTPHGKYEMRHDIYSVGVCMLEIGLWDTFVTYSAPREPAQHGPGLGIKDDNENGSELFQKPESMKAHFLDLARGGRLEKAMGEKYCKIVETCLTCLDKGNVDFGDDKEFRDGDGVLVRSKYIEKVYTQLSEIVV